MAQYRAITEGFDLYNGVEAGGGLGLESVWTRFGAASPSLQVGRFGGRCVRVASVLGVNAIRRAINPTSLLAIGVAVSLSEQLRVWPIIKLSSTSGEQLRLEQTVTGALSVVRGSTVLATSQINMLPINQWSYIEFCCEISDTTGKVRVYLNGVEVDELRVDDADTAGQSTMIVDFIDLGNTIGTGYSASFDDLYVECDGMTPVGEGRIWTGRVNADVVAQFTSSTGTDNYEAVDEVPVSATDYNYSDTIGARDIFEVTDLDFAPSEIYGIQITQSATKDEAGVRAAKAVLISDATEVQGSQFVLALSAINWHHDFWKVNPDTGVAWTIGDYNAINIGYEITL